MKTGQKILIVEDEPDIRKLVNYNLAQERFKVLEAEDGEQGAQRSSNGTNRIWSFWI